MRSWFSFSVVGIVSFFVGVVAVWVISTSPEPATIEPARCPTIVSVPVEPEPAPSPSASKSLSDIDVTDPYTLAHSLDGQMSVEMDELWSRLGVRSEIGEAFFSFCHGCKAEVISFNLDDTPQNEVIVRIANTMEECRYLVFKQVDSDPVKYKLICHIDHDFGRYEMPSHHFVVSEGRPYLVIRGQTASGSGVATYNYRLFRLNRERLEELVEYPADGHQAMTTLDPIREWSTRVRNVTSLSDGTTRIELDLTLNYLVEDYDGSGPVRGGHWTKHARAVYIKPSGKRKAYLDKRSSTVTQHQIESEYNIDFLDDNDLARYNRSQLRRLGWKPPAAH